LPNSKQRPVMIAEVRTLVQGDILARPLRVNFHPSAAPLANGRYVRTPAVPGGDLE